MEMPIRVNRDFGKTYLDASASATERATNLARTGDLVLGAGNLTLQPLDVSPAGGLVQGILKAAGPAVPAELHCDRLIVSRATVTGALDTLVKRGLVRREPHPTDRRMVLVHLLRPALEWPTKFAAWCIAARRNGWGH